MLWYLVIPPVIVIVSLTLLIWFLSKKSEQVSIQERMADIENQSSFREWQTLRFKQIILRFLERSSRSLKVFSLRVHNLFHRIGQSIHERRRQSDLLATSLLSLRKQEKAESSHERTHSEADEEDFSASDTAEDPLASTPRDLEVSGGVPSLDQPLIRRKSRPMVSERMVVPETKPNKVMARDIKEEERLIKKIAANPKNISAYEALGDYYLEQGNANDAKACYRQVLKLSPVHRMVKVKIRKLERLMEEQKID